MITTTIYLLHRNKNHQQKFKFTLKVLKVDFGGEVEEGFISYSKANIYRNPFQAFMLSPQISSWPLGILYCPVLPTPSVSSIYTTAIHIVCRIHVLLSGVVLWPWASCVFSLAHLSAPLGPLLAESFSLRHLVFQLHSGAQPRRGKTRSIDFRRSFSDNLGLFQDTLWCTYNVKSSLKHFSNQSDVLFWEILQQLLEYSSFLHITTPVHLTVSSLDCDILEGRNFALFIFISPNP